MFNLFVLKVKYNKQCDAERTTLQKTSAKNMQSNGQPFKLPRSSRGHWALNSDSKGLMKIQGKGKAIPLQAWTGPEGSRRLKLPDFKTVGT